MTYQTKTNGRMHNYLKSQRGDSSGEALVAVIMAAILALGVRGCYNESTGRLVYDGRIDGRRVEYRLNTGIADWDHDELVIYNRDGKRIEAIIRDGGCYGHGIKDIDGKVDEVSLFDSKGREKRITPQEVRGYDGIAYTGDAQRHWEAAAEKKAIQGAQKVLEDASSKYQELTAKIQKIIEQRTIDAAKDKLELK